MRIILFGTGRMGQAIMRLAKEKAYELVAAYNSSNIEQAKKHGLPTADVCIDFSSPEAVIQNIQFAWKTGLPIVVGTTGWYDHLDEIKRRAQNGEGTILVGSNFAPGVNLLFLLSETIAKFINFFDFNVGIKEIHHIHKKDAPSGTAITIANKIINFSNKFDEWKLTQDEKKASAKTLPIYAVREGEEVGTHIISLENKLERLKVEHNALSREVFALGALEAAKWIINKSGFFTVEDFYKKILS